MSVYVIGRLSFPALVEPRENLDGREQFECVVPLDAESEKAVREACEEAARAKWGKVPEGLRLPIKVHDEDDRYFAGQVTIRPWSKKQPVCIGRDKTPKDPGDFYAGCHVQLAVSPRTYDKSGKGVFLSLDAVRFVRDDDAFGGGVNVDAFPELPEVDAVEDFI